MSEPLEPTVETPAAEATDRKSLLAAAFEKAEAPAAAATALR